jgi:hypothetical protein
LIFIARGRELTFLYNDAYAQILDNALEALPSAASAKRFEAH